MSVDQCVFVTFQSWLFLRVVRYLKSQWPRRDPAAPLETITCTKRSSLPLHSNLDYHNSEDFTINPWWLRSKTSVGDSKNPFLLKLVWKVYFLRSLIKTKRLCFINKRNGNTSFWDSNPTFPWSGRSFSNPVSDF